MAINYSKILHFKSFKTILFQHNFGPIPVKKMHGSAANHGEALRFKPEDEDYLMYEEASPPLTTTFLTLDRASLPRKTKGRVPERSIEGWIVLVTGVHKEAQENDLKEVFRDHGVIKNIKINFDHRYGFVHSALIEYEHYEEAMNAIQKSNGSEFLTQTIYVDWAFITGPAVNLRRY
ncbi:RNA recognition motif [Medicago truncatula]|uniref:RNA recognition motif n=1 Tax=Medicago truncatula TaxID=3880 RepID=A0A072UWY4_MEDTR|nr:RNA recognition motif [Medicago truncatula]